MNPRKFHISPMLTLGLATLLAVGCLLAAVSISFARYRGDYQGGIHFRPDEVAQLHLGYVSDGAFIPWQSNWVAQNDTMELSFAVSNGKTAAECSREDQRLRLRVIASLGAWEEDGREPITLTVDGKTYTAQVERIQESSALYSQFGEGWVFCFLDAEGKEPTWDLPGGSFCYTEMLLQVSAAAMPDTSLLQLQVIGEVR